MSVCSNHYVFSISEILRLYGTCEFRRTHIYVCVFRLYASTCVSVRVWQSALTTLLLKAVNRNRELYFVDCRSAKMSRYCLHINLGQREHMPSSSAQWLFCNLVQEKQYRPVQPKKKKKTSRNYSSHHSSHLSHPFFQLTLSLQYVYCWLALNFNKWRRIFLFQKLYFSSCHCFINQEEAFWKMFCFGGCNLFCVCMCVCCS